MATQEQAFSLIEEGYFHKRKKAPLDAIACFIKASDILRQLSSHDSRVTKLFKSQAELYRSKSRDLFLDHVKGELSPSESKKRGELFAVLFNDGFGFASKQECDSPVPLEGRMVALSSSSCSSISANENDEPCLAKEVVVVDKQHCAGPTISQYEAAPCCSTCKIPLKEDKIVLNFEEDKESEETQEGTEGKFKKELKEEPTLKLNVTVGIVEKQQRSEIVKVPTNLEMSADDNKQAVLKCEEDKENEEPRPELDSMDAIGSTSVVAAEEGNDEPQLQARLDSLSTHDSKSIVTAEKRNDEPQPRARFDSLSTQDSLLSAPVDEGTARMRLKDIDSKSTVSSISAMNELDLIVAQAHDEASFNRRRRVTKSSSAHGSKKKIAQILQKQLGVAITASDEYIEVQEESSIKSRLQSPPAAENPGHARERTGAQSNGLKSMLFNAQTLLLEASAHMHETDDEAAIKELLMDAKTVVEVVVNKLEGRRRPRASPRQKATSQTKNIKNSLQHRGKFSR